MLWFAAALASAAPVEQPATPQRHAQAVVRILRPAIIRMGEGAVHGDQRPLVRETRLPGSDGLGQPLILIEFS